MKSHITTYQQPLSLYFNNLNVRPFNNALGSFICWTNLGILLILEKLRSSIIHIIPEIYFDYFQALYKKSNLFWKYLWEPHFVCKWNGLILFSACLWLFYFGKTNFIYCSYSFVKLYFSVFQQVILVLQIRGLWLQWKSVRSWKSHYGVSFSSWRKVWQ